MSEIDWNENVKVVVREFVCYIGKVKDCERYFEYIVLKIKIVVDVVEYYNGEFLEGEVILGIVYLNNKIVFYYVGLLIVDGINLFESYIVCICE